MGRVEDGERSSNARERTGTDGNGHRPSGDLSRRERLSRKAIWHPTSSRSHPKSPRVKSRLASEVNEMIAHQLASALFVTLLALCLGFSNAHMLSGSGFPWEGCKERHASAGYNATLYSYMESSTGSQMCFRIYTTNFTECMKNNNAPNNKTRCCDTMFNKMKFWPAQNCWRAIKNVKVQLASWDKPHKVSVQKQIMTPSQVADYDRRLPPSGRLPRGSDQWVAKVTNLNWSHEEVDGATICLQLKAPCANLQTYAANGETLEWLLYDIKVDNYECCVPGLTDVTNQTVYPGR
eukprot:gene14959-21015_t